MNKSIDWDSFVDSKTIVNGFGSSGYLWAPYTPMMNAIIPIQDKAIKAIGDDLDKLLTKCIDLQLRKINNYFKKRYKNKQITEKDKVDITSRLECLKFTPIMGTYFQAIQTWAVNGNGTISDLTLDLKCLGW